MDRFIIRGGRRLSGEITIGGAKNAGLKLMAAGLLTSKRLILSNVPQIADIALMGTLLRQHGIAVEPHDDDGRTLSIGGEVTSIEAPYDIVSKMRASILVLGPLLTRMGQARVSLPGGCAIGTRPVDMHLRGLEALGAKITLENGYINASAPKGLRGEKIVLPFASVGATENILLAATLAKGRTEIVNAAREPEIGDLSNCLNKMGARITGHGSGSLIIDGVDALHGAEHAIMADRIECGTYACAAGITGGDVLLIGGHLEDFGAALKTFEACGVELTAEPRGIRVRRDGPLKGVDIMTEPFPGFPTDMQAQFMAMLSVANGASLITETIFENRFMHVPELARMGARITVHKSSAIIRGCQNLSGAPVMATDLRASFSLILAGLAAEGETTVSRVYHLDRGYEKVDVKLAAVGADIVRINDA